MIELDGLNTGFCVSIGGDPNKFISTKMTGIRKFDNLNVAKVSAERFSNEKNFVYYIKPFADSDEMIALDDCQYIGNGKYQVVIDGKVETIVEKRRFATNNLGYIIFDNGDTCRVNKADGVKIRNDMRKIIKWALEVLSVCYTGCCGISKIHKDKGEFIAYVNGTTARIHIESISKMMDMNQARKEAGLRAFPYDKNLDKYICFYVYGTKDMSESRKLRADERIKEIINEFVRIINDEFPDHTVKYKPIEDYKSYLMVDEED